MTLYKPSTFCYEYKAFSGHTTLTQQPEKEADIF